MVFPLFISYRWNDILWVEYSTPVLSCDSPHIRSPQNVYSGIHPTKRSLSFGVGNICGDEWQRFGFHSPVLAVGDRE